MEENASQVPGYDSGFLLEQIEKNYFHRNFGSLSKSDFELLIFTMYFRRYLLLHRDSTSEVDIARELGITPQRVAALRLKYDLRYREAEENWMDIFTSALEKAQYDEESGKIALDIPERLVLYRVREVGRLAGASIEYSTTSPDRLKISPESLLILLNFVELGSQEKVTKVMCQACKDSGFELGDYRKTPLKKMLKNAVRQHGAGIALTCLTPLASSAAPAVAELGSVALELLKSVLPTDSADANGK